MLSGGRWVQRQTDAYLAGTELQLGSAVSWPWPPTHPQPLQQHLPPRTSKFFWMKGETADSSLLVDTPAFLLGFGSSTLSSWSPLFHLHPFFSGLHPPRLRRWQRLHPRPPALCYHVRLTWTPVFREREKFRLKLVHWRSVYHELHKYVYDRMCECVCVWERIGFLFVAFPAVPYLHDSTIQTSCHPHTRAHCCSCRRGAHCIPHWLFFFSFIFFGGLELLAEILDWMSPETTEQDLEVLASAAKFPLH